MPCPWYCWVQAGTKYPEALCRPPMVKLWQKTLLLTNDTCCQQHWQFTFGKLSLFHTIRRIWGLFDHASSSWNNLKCRLDATRWFYWCILSSTCFGYIRPSSGALDVELQHTVLCTEFVDGWWFWEPLRRSCVRCGWWRTPSAPYAHRTHGQIC